MSKVDDIFDPAKSRLRWLNRDCNSCGRRVNTWEARISLTLGYRYTCCESCVAKEYGMTDEELREELETQYGMTPCVGI